MQSYGVARKATSTQTQGSLEEPGRKWCQSSSQNALMGWRSLRIGKGRIKGILPGEAQPWGLMEDRFANDMALGTNRRSYRQRGVADWPNRK
jgi:hypothetical protein